MFSLLLPGIFEFRLLLDVDWTNAQNTERREPYGWQMQAMLQLVLNHRNMPVVLKAPCGAGKTSVLMVLRS